MNRREFIRSLAVLAAGAAALPEQINAFEKLFSVNAGPGEIGLIAINEVGLYGTAGTAQPIIMNIFNKDKFELSLGLNLFGGIMRWISGPVDAIRIGKPEDLRYEFRDPTFIANGYVYNMSGMIRVTDQDMKQYAIRLDRPATVGTLADLMRNNKVALEA